MFDMLKHKRIFCLSGLYKVDVKLGGAAILHSPFFVKSFDKSRVRVFGLSDAVVDKQTSFTGRFATSRRIHCSITHHSCLKDTNNTLLSVHG